MKTELTQEQKRIRIAEACGWMPQEPWESARGNLVYEWKKTGELNEDCQPGHREHELPDYFNDLNACHEMENSMADGIRMRYQHELNRVMLDTFNENSWLISATAEQRAEAFGKTLGLW